MVLSRYHTFSNTMQWETYFTSMVFFKFTTKHQSTWLGDIQQDTWSIVSSKTMKVMGNKPRQEKLSQRLERHAREMLYLGSDSARQKDLKGKSGNTQSAVEDYLATPCYGGNFTTFKIIQAKSLIFVIFPEVLKKGSISLFWSALLLRSCGTCQLSVQQSHMDRWEHHSVVGNLCWI